MKNTLKINILCAFIVAKTNIKIGVLALLSLGLLVGLANCTIYIYSSNGVYDGVMVGNEGLKGNFLITITDKEVTGNAKTNIINQFGVIGTYDNNILEFKSEDEEITPITFRGVIIEGGAITGTFSVGTLRTGRFTGQRR